jgi:hypothetical protein
MKASYEKTAQKRFFKETKNYSRSLGTRKTKVTIEDPSHQKR